jgi:hypothetical protein
MALPYIRITQNIILPTGPDQRTVVSVATPSGRVIHGGFDFDWDSVDEIPVSIEVKHAGQTYQYFGDSFMMFKSAFSTTSGIRELELHVGIRKGNKCTGHCFKKGSIAQETVYDLSLFNFLTLAKIMRG